MLVTWPKAAGQEPTQKMYPTPTTPTALLQLLQVGAGLCAVLGAEKAGKETVVPGHTVPITPNFLRCSPFI